MPARQLAQSVGAVTVRLPAEYWPAAHALGPAQKLSVYAPVVL